MNDPGGGQFGKLYHDGLIPARLTAYQSGRYSWAEQYQDQSGYLQDHPQGRGGTAYSGPLGSPAVEINGNVVAVPAYAWLRQRGPVEGVVSYDFQAGAGGVSGGVSLASGDTNNFYSFNVFNNYFTWVYTTVVGSGRVSIPDLTFPSPKLRAVFYSGTLIQGITGGVSGRLAVIWNAGDGASPAEGPFSLGHLNPAAANGDRILCPAKGDYTLWPGDGAIIQFDGTPIAGAASGVWRFDHPTIGAGATVGGGGVSGLATYALRHLKVGSGLTYLRDETAGGEGAGIVMLTSGSAGSDRLVAVTSGDTTPGHLISKLISPDNSVLFTVTNGGGNEVYNAQVNFSGGPLSGFSPGSGGSAIANGEVILSGGYVCTTSFADTGLHITLPSAGQYLVQAEVTGSISVSGTGGAYVSCRLSDRTAGAAYTDTVRVVCEAETTSAIGRGTAPCGRIISVGSGITVSLDATYTATGAVASGQAVIHGGVSPTTTGTTLIRYLRLGN